jgi:hypothetical protein
MYGGTTQWFFFGHPSKHVWLKLLNSRNMRFACFYNYIVEQLGWSSIFTFKSFLAAF